MCYYYKRYVLPCLVLGMFPWQMTVSGGNPKLSTPAIANGPSNIVWGAPAGGLQMAISLASPGQKIVTNSPVQVVFRFRNTNSDKRFMMRPRADYVHASGLSFSVISPDGHDISPIPESPTMNPFIESLVFFEPDGHIWEFSGDLSEVCRFNRPGTYKIIARQRLNRVVKGVGKRSATLKLWEVVSNPLSITVVAAGQASSDGP